MKFGFRIVVAVLLLGIQCLRAQNKPDTDSLLKILESPVNDTTKINLYIKLSRNLQKSFPDSATAFIEKGLELAKKINYKKGEADLYRNLGDINWSRGNLDQAREYFYKALEYYSKQTGSSETNQSIIGLAYCYNGLGIVCFVQGNYNEALGFFQLSLENHEKVSNKIGIAKCYNNIGLVHWKQDNFERAIEYFEDSQSLYKEIVNNGEVAASYNNLAIIYKKQKKYDLALKNYNLSLEILLANNNLKGIALCYNNIGMLHEELNDFSLAEDYYQKAIELKTRIDDKPGISSTLGNLASLYNKIAQTTSNEREKRNKYNQAIEIATKGLNIASEIGTLNQKMDIYEILYVSYNGLDKFEESLKYYKLRTELKDSLFNKEKNKQIEDAEAKYQAAKKQQEIERQQLQLKRQEYLRNTLIGFIVFILISGVLLYSGFNLKKKTNKELNHKNKLLEEKNEELKKLSLVASKTSNAIIIFNKDGKIEWFNEACSKIYGYSLEEFIANMGKDIFTSSNNPKIREHLDICINTKESVIYEAAAKTKQGLGKWIQTTLTPILDDTGQIEKFVAIDSDISELKKAEQIIILKNEEILSQNEEMLAQNEELENHRNHLEKLVNERTIDLEKAKLRAEESDKLKSAFLANMSHEIRTPMNAIVGFTSLLNDPSISEAEKKEINNQVINNSNTLLKLIEDIIDIANIETGQIRLDNRECNINEMLAELLDVYQENLARQNKENIKLICNTEIDQKEGFTTDPSRLKQVLIKLLDNAIKFTEKGQIEFGCNKEIVDDNSYMHFYVKDTGIGLSKEIEKYIFQRFGKVEIDKKKLYRGTGLGLTISKNVVELMGGKIWAESEDEKGSVFNFIIPFKN